MKDIYGIELTHRKLSQVKYIVDGYSFRVWREWHNLLKFEQDGMGLTFAYHRFKKGQECWASLFFYTIDGIVTAFVDAHGRYQDYVKLEEFVFKLCNMTPGRDNHCDEINFCCHIAWDKLSPGEKKKRLEINKELKIKDLQSGLSI